ncbi:MAG: hypothetical protein KDA20_04190 [Phycisphaerales bacterium]|nr:hypothetical protein [Phycisphaerales bacterium]
MRKLITSALCSTRRTAGRTIAAVALAVGLAAPVLAQEGGPQRQAIIGFEFAGCNALFPDDNDAGLRRALHMIPDRIKEVLETPEIARDMGNDFPRPLVYALLDNLGGSMRMIVTQRGFDEATGQPRLGAVLSMQLADAQAAKTMHGEIEKLRQMAGEEGPPIEPSNRFPGMNDVQAPFGIISYGPRQSGNDWRYEIIFGDIPDADGVFDLLPKAELDGSVCRGVIDFAAASPFTGMLAGMANMGGGREGGLLVDYFKGMGLLGPNAISAEWEVAYPGDFAQEVWRVRRAGQYADGLGLSHEVISREDFTVIPADASFISIKKMEPQREFAKVKQMLGAMDDGAWEEVKGQIHEALGVDLEEGLINALGKTGVFYFADSTGGGSLLSGVLLVELSNPRTMIETLNTLADRLNGMIADEIDTEVVSVKMDKYMRDGIPFMEMRVRGAPVPSVPTLAVVGNWLVISPTPQGCTAAAAQAKGVEASSALRNRALSALGVRGDMATQLMVIDPARTMRDGYSVTTLLCGALENAVRSPNGQRDPGMVMPIHNVLAADAHPMLMTAKWDGEDYVVNTIADRSSLVNAAMMLGVGDVGEVLFGAALGAGITGAACKDAMERQHYGDWDESWDMHHDDDFDDMEADPDDEDWDDVDDMHDGQ